jgi:alkylhydroperoxidase/carboxymuconolactone decarboxylase family protein YurZ
VAHARTILTIALAFGATITSAHVATPPHPLNDLAIHMTTETTETTLEPRQQAIVPIAAHAAIGDMTGLNAALIRGLDAGLTVSDCKEILVQMYAYAGFPRSLNALSELMRVLQARKDQGIEDAPGRDAGPVPQGAALLAAGTANQTKLAGAPVKGALFDFAPAIDQYLKTHLFGDIFARDNLDWKDREIATVAALAAMSGVEPQLQAHMRLSMNVGVSAQQLRHVAQVLADTVSADASQRAQAALQAHLPQ